MNVILKFTLGTLVSVLFLLWLYTQIGYEKAELVGFSILIGLSVAALKSH